MRVIREYPRRSERDQVHSVREDDFGNLFCTCPAGNFNCQCWALKKEIGEREYRRMIDKKYELAGVVLPNQEAKRQEQMAYVYGEMKRLHIGVQR